MGNGLSLDLIGENRGFLCKVLIAGWLIFTGDALYFATEMKKTYLNG
jgi:hypothetical protein